MGSDDSAARNPAGPADRNVMENVAQLRRARGLSYARLSARLSDLGRPIAVLGLRRIEQGKRRVDAGDLVALALALGVNPSALLLPRSVAAGDNPVALTPAVTYPATEAWRWADGDDKRHHSNDFLVHARPEYEVRGQLEGLGKLARDAPGVEDAVPGFTDATRRMRDDFSKLARETVPGFTDAARAAEWAVWTRREEEEERRQEAEAEAEAEAERQHQARNRTPEPTTEGEDHAEDQT